MKPATEAGQALADLESWTRSHRRDLVGTAFAVLRDRDEAEDVVQETLLRVWRRAGSSPIRRGGAYLSRAVYWNALKHRARRREELPVSEADRPAQGGPAAGNEEWTLSCWELERAIADLPLAQQAVIRLRFYLGLSLQEAGRALSIPANTVASRSRYALDRLRRRLTAPQGEARSRKE